MDAVVPQEITTELTQILANLVLGDNKIRSKYDFTASYNSILTRWTSAEKAVNDRLAQTPDLYLLALAQFAIAADTEVASSQHADTIMSLTLRSSVDEILFLGPPSPHPLSCRTQSTAKGTAIDPLRSPLLAGLDHSRASPPSLALP